MKTVGPKVLTTLTTSITGTARSVLAIFYIVTTFLSGHTSAWM
jgi:hypothetical protein